VIKRFPLLSRLCLLIIIPAVTALALIYHSMLSSLPSPRTTLAWPGNDPGNVTILRDEHGVPHIQGDSDLAVFYAMGYAQAQDRLWQLTLQQRIAQGRLSEVFGRGLIKQDAWFRTLGLYRTATKDLLALSDSARASLQAYSDGVNAWVAGHPTLPPEFIALGIQPLPWTPVDSLAWIKVFALNLSGNLDDEMQRYIASAYFTKEQIAFLYKGHDAERADISEAQKSARMQALAAVLEGQRLVKADLNLGGKWLGSNAWVASGRLSREGRATLANDPHLGLSIPSWWYPATLEGKHLRSTGMSLVGLPAVVLGLNDDIAWGATSMTADVQDLYFETLDAGRPGHYLYNGKWEPLEVRSEEIKVKADFPSFLRTELKPVQLQIRSTLHGPIVTDTEPALDATGALRWVALEVTDTTYEALLNLNYARNWQEFKSALALFVSPALNFLYADVQGNIGYMGAGRIPIRKQGQGALPVPGMNDQYAWQGYIPFDKMPQRYNPPEGYLVSANDDITGPDYPYFISDSWAPPGRAQRIRQLLAQSIERTGEVDFNAHQQIQHDVLSLPATRMMGALGLLAGRTPRQEQALERLRHWDGSMSMDSVPATIFNVWMRHLVDQVFAAKAAVPFNQRGHIANIEAMFANTTTDQLYAALTEADSPWCRPGEKPMPCATALYAALDKTLDELEKLKGTDMQAWRWGDVQSAFYEHNPFSFIKPFNTFFERKVGTPGSTDTVNVAYSRFSHSEGYLKHTGAGFRQIIQMGQGTNVYSYMNSTGQSGNVMSAHYADMLIPFEQGQYYRMTLKSTGIEKDSSGSTPHHDAHQ
jgi:penicillin amidase